MIRKIFDKQTTNITSAAYILAFASILSALLGLIRDRLLAGHFGAGPVLDIYYASFRLPDLVFAVLISGGITAAFLPVFSEYFAKNKGEAWQLATNTLNIFLFFAILTSGLFLVLTPWLIPLIVPGFRPEYKSLTILLTRIMFLSPILLGISSIFSSVLQYFNRFLAYSLAPIFYNLGIIFGILVFAPLFGPVGLAYGVVLGALLHWLIQAPAVFKIGFKWKPVFYLSSPGLKKIVKLMIPRTISAVASHFNLVVVTAIASTIGAGSIAIFNFAQNLRSLPIIMVGSSFAIAAYPFLARDWAQGKKKEFLKNFSATIRQVLFLVIPLSFLIFILRAQFVRIILGTGKFGWLDTRLTAAALGIFSISIFAYALIPILARMFFSLQDTKTPFAIASLSVAFNIGFSFLFVWLLKFPNWFSRLTYSALRLTGIKHIAVIGLPLALSLAGILQLILLFIFLYKKLGGFDYRILWYSFARIILVSSLSCFLIYPTLYLVAGIVNMHKLTGILIQATLASLVGILGYLFIFYIFKMPEFGLTLNNFIYFLKRKKRRLPWAKK